MTSQKESYCSFNTYIYLISHELFKLCCDNGCLIYISILTTQTNMLSHSPFSSLSEAFSETVHCVQSCINLCCLHPLACCNTCKFNCNTEPHELQIWSDGTPNCIYTMSHLPISLVSSDSSG